MEGNRMATIKKYRRKVSDERVERAAQALFHYWMDDSCNHFPSYTYEEWGDKDYFRRCTRAALEADAVTTEGLLKYSVYFQAWYFSEEKGHPRILEKYRSEDHFHEEWEEIE
jgi:hypothetical protein